MTDIISDYFREQVQVKVKSDIVLGIDLGTCNSCCCVWNNGVAQMIYDDAKRSIIPSVVSFGSNVKVGFDADLPNIHNIKRLIGRQIDDPSVVNDRVKLDYPITVNSRGNIVVNGRTPEEISSYILMKLKNMAIDQLKCDIKQAVIAVPAHFNDTQRQATRDAATIAGLDCVRIISEPVAASLAYGLNKLDTKFIVFDLGGGTLDITLLYVNDGVFEVIGAVGDTHLGGMDFDNLIADYCVSHMQLQGDIQREDLVKRCENAKKQLSDADTVDINIGDKHIAITQEILSEICDALVCKCISLLAKLINRCHSSIEEVVLVGGMTRMPLIRNSIKLFCGKQPNCSVNPDETVAIGAAIQGYIIANKKDPFSESFVLLDIVPLSLGVETFGGIMSIIIPRGSYVPITETRVYTNDIANETSITIRIFEGERKVTKHNFLIGEFVLNGITPAPKGYHKIEVTFTLDINGILLVTARDLRHGCKSSFTVNSNRLTENELSSMITSAKVYEEDDKQNKCKLKLMNELHELHDRIIKSGETVDIVDIDDMDLQTCRSEITRLRAKYYTILTRDDATVDAFSQDTPVNIGTSVFQTDTHNKTRDELVVLCHDIIERAEKGAVLDLDTRDYVIDFANDILLWIHVQNEIILEEFQRKRDDLLMNCGHQVYSTDSQQELIMLINALKFGIEHRTLPLDDEKYILLRSIVTNADPSNNCDEQIKMINEYCDKI
jgi:molecular chaperone DnaK (HSP70)